MVVLGATERELGPLLEALEGHDLPARQGSMDMRAPGHQDGPLAWPTHRQGVIDGRPVTVVLTGVGKANAAAATALAIERYAPRTLLLTGIGGAYPGAPLGLGDVALAVAEVHLDTGVGHGATWQGMASLGFALLPGPPPRYNRMDLDAASARELASRLGVHALVFGTAESVTADAATAMELRRRHDVAIESMEGAAVAQVALAMGVDVVEIRGVSNVVGERDRSRWDIAGAIRASCAVARAALPFLP